MAKMIIEIDTGKLSKLDGGRTAASVTTIANLRALLKEADGRLEQMGADANGVVLYGPAGPRGKITLTESDQRTGHPRNWYDDTIHSGVPLSERRGCREIECWCHDPGAQIFTPTCGQCGCIAP